MSKKLLFATLLSTSLLLAASGNTPQDKLEKAPSYNQNRINQQATILQQQDSTKKQPKVDPSAGTKKLTIKEAALKAINSVRTRPQICSKGAKPLTWSKHLYNMAKEHSIDMAVTGLLQHNGSGTKTDVTAKRLKLNRGSYFYERVNQKVNSKNLYSGELIIRTSLHTLASPKTLIDYWIKQPKDCQLIMNPNFTSFAMAKVVSHKDNRAYWTLLLAGKRK